MRFIFISLCNFVVMITLIAGSWASKVVTPSDTKYINEADVLLTVTIVDRVDKTEECSSSIDFKLTPVATHGGKMRKALLSYQISWPSLYTETGHKPGCPESVWYVSPPQARELKRGATIVVTAAFEELSGQFRVTASFDLDRLSQLKALFKARPHP